MKAEKKIAEVIDRIHAELRDKFKEKVDKIILFGSYAREDYDYESDLDILVLLDDDNPKRFNDEIVDLEVDLTIAYGISPSIILRNTKYYNENKEIVPFFKNVEREGMPIYAA